MNDPFPGARRALYLAGLQLKLERLRPSATEARGGATPQTPAGHGPH